jgi:hypothetical protein
MPGTDKAISDVIEQTSPAHEVAPEPSLEETFKTLADWWERDTLHHSSTTILRRHPAYLKLVELGEPVIPLILREMQARLGNYRLLLRDITGERPFSDELRGNVRAIEEAWLRWGKERGYCK